MKQATAGILGFLVLMPMPLFAAEGNMLPSPDVPLPTITLALDMAGGCVVAGEIVIEYDVDLFTLAAIDRESSVFTLWLPDATSTGRIILTGGVPGGFCGAFSGGGIVTSIASLSFVPLTPLSSLDGHIRIGAESALYDGTGEHAPASVVL